MSIVLAEDPEPEVRPALTVQLAGPGDSTDWNDFVERHPEGSFFHRFEWRRVLAESVGFRPHYLLARRGASIAGLLPLVLTSSPLFGRAMSSLPFCVEGGVIAGEDAARDALLAAAVEASKAAGAAYLELRHARRQAPHWICKDGVYANFRRPLLPTTEENLLAIPRKQRAVVRKGIEGGLVSCEEEDLTNFFPIYATSVRNLGTPVFPRRYFRVLLETLRPHLRITTVFSGKRAVAAVLSFLHKGAVMPYYGGGLPMARDCRAYDFMYWEVMRTACEAGLTSFDYGRSKVGTGAYAFKKNWGFEAQPLQYEYCLMTARGMPERNPAHPRYALAVALWKKLPLPLANLLGARISPYLA